MGGLRDGRDEKHDRFVGINERTPPPQSIGWEDGHEIAWVYLTSDELCVFDGKHGK